MHPGTGGGPSGVFGGKENCSSSSLVSFSRMISMGGRSIHSSTVGGPGINSSGHSTTGSERLVITGGGGGGSKGVVRGSIGGGGCDTGISVLGFFGSFGLLS